jgi:hypothetical protein
MRRSFFVIAFIVFSLAVGAQTTRKTDVPDPAKKIMVVEASCGQCKFHLKGKGCQLTVRMDGKAYFVDGTSIDEHGDAHADDGFCLAIRKAEVQGSIVNNRFVATYFKLLPEPTAQKPKTNR